MYGRIAASAVLALMCVFQAFAVTSSAVASTLDRSVISAAGDALSGTNYRLYGSLGQFISGTSSGTSYSLEVGFLAFDWDTDQDGMPDWWERQYPECLDADDPTDALEDCDNDELNNLDEYNHRTGPTNRDTDSDTMHDGWEVRYGLDPLKDDKAGDPDKDDLTNGQEFQWKTNPKNSDSDLDGMADGWEVEYSGPPCEMHPLEDWDAQEDCDGDGVKNVDEYRNGTRPDDTDPNFEPRTFLEIRNLPADMWTLDPSVSPDGQVLVFAMCTPHALHEQDIHYARRCQGGNQFCFEYVGPVSGVNTDLSQFSPFLTFGEGGSRYRLLFGGYSWGTGKDAEIWWTLCDPYTMACDTPTLIPGDVNTVCGEGDPTLTSDRGKLYFTECCGDECSIENFRGNLRLARWNGNGYYRDNPLSPEYELKNVNTQQYAEYASQISPNGLVFPDALALYFTSNRPGRTGQRDLWVAFRSRRDKPFEAPKNIATLNTHSYDEGPWVSGDGCSLIWHSTYPSGCQVYFSKWLLPQCQ